MRLVSVSAPVAAVLPPLAPAVEGSLAVSGVSLRYRGVLALDNVTLDAADGEILCLLGPSGSGKSSLLRIIAGVERPSTGRVTLNGLEVAGPARFVDPENRRVGMVFQDYALFPHLTVARQRGVRPARPAPRRDGPDRRAPCSTGWGSRGTRAAIRTCCRAASGSASRWRGRSPRSRGSC